MTRKLLLFTAAFVFTCTVTAQAQDLKSILGGIVQSAVGDKLTTKQSILGTWKYKAPACEFENKESNNNLLSTATSSVAATTAESTLIKVYDKLGLDQCIFVFNEDGSYSTTLGKIKTKGSYTFNAEEKTITLKTKLGLTLTAKVAVTGSSMTLMFNADKLISAVKAITGVASNLTQYAKAINSLAEKYDGMMLGFELTKNS